MHMNTKQKQPVKLSREEKALQLFQAGAVKRIHDDCYMVRSQNPNPKNSREYEVIPSMNVCTCIDFERTGQNCKHAIATQLYRTSQIAAAVTAANLEAFSKFGKVVGVVTR
jgi:SWIM zinc finger